MGVPLLAMACGTTTPAQLGLKLLRTLPKKLTHRFRVQVLADTGFSSVEFLNGVKKLRHQAIVGIPNNRKLADGRQIKMLGSDSELHQFCTDPLDLFVLKRKPPA